MTAYWLYSRLGVHVAASDDALMAALDSYADENVVGGSAVLTDAHRSAVRDQHAQAFVLYASVMAGV
jgi:hypothetical protein